MSNPNTGRNSLRPNIVGTSFVNASMSYPQPPQYSGSLNNQMPVSGQLGARFSSLSSINDGRQQFQNYPAQFLPSNQFDPNANYYGTPSDHRQSLGNYPPPMGQSFGRQGQQPPSVQGPTTLVRTRSRSSNINQDVQYPEPYISKGQNYIVNPLTNQIPQHQLPPPSPIKKQKSNTAAQKPVDDSNDLGAKQNRGRKLTETTKYIKDSQLKIEGWKVELKKAHKKNDKETIHSLRNKISALESRIAKRQELKQLQEKIVSRRTRFEQLVNIFDDVSCDPCTKIFCSHVKEALPIDKSKNQQPSRNNRGGPKANPFEGGDEEVKSDLKGLLMALYDSVQEK